MLDFNNKKVAVLGFGIEGESVINFLLKKNALTSVFDRKNKEDFDQKRLEKFEKLGINFFFGLFPANFANFDFIVRSPGIYSNLPQLVAARKKNIKITSAIKIFFDLCPAKIVGVTGTKGKGTTSALIYEMLKKAGKDVYLGGNIGMTPLEFLDKLNTQSIVVLELSSFQLQDLDKSPHIAIILMLTSEHLNYHKDIYEYVEAKRNILRFQTPSDFAIVNADYPASNESDVITDGKVFKVSREKEVDEGCFVMGGKVIVRGHVFLESEIQNSRSGTNSNLLNSKSQNISNFGIRASNLNQSQVEIINTEDILLPGAHNLENICAASLAAVLLGINKKDIIAVLKTFKGLEHRLELVAEVGGVKYYDDSFSTTPETAIAALEAFPKNHKVLMLGGSSKNSDFSELGQAIENNAETIRAIIGIGEEWDRIKKQFTIHNSKFKIIEGLNSMPDVVRKAADIALPGDVVLLSPACASFDMFKNYKDRGEQFKREVLRLNTNENLKHEK